MPRASLPLNTYISHVPTTILTPTPPDGFPKIHIHHDTHILDQLHPTTRREWSAVPQPKLLIRIFGTATLNPQPVHHSLPILILNTITTACEGLLDPSNPPRIHHPPYNTSSGILLVSNLPPDAARLLLSGRIWSSPSITLELCDFYTPHLTPLLISLLIPYDTHESKTLLTLRDLWFCPPVETRIHNILNQGNNDAPSPLTELHNTIHISCLPSNLSTETSHKILNVTAYSSTASPRAWTSLKSFLQRLNYPITDRGPILTITGMQCHICNSVAHEAQFCPFPNIPLWNGPVPQPPPPPHNLLSLADAERDERIKAGIETELLQLARNESIYG